MRKLLSILFLIITCSTVYANEQLWTGKSFAEFLESQSSYSSNSSNENELRSLESSISREYGSDSDGIDRETNRARLSLFMCDLINYMNNNFNMQNEPGVSVDDFEDPKRISKILITTMTKIFKHYEIAAKRQDIDSNAESENSRIFTVSILVLSLFPISTLINVMTILYDGKAENVIGKSPIKYCFASFLSGVCSVVILGLKSMQNISCDSFVKLANEKLIHTRTWVEKNLPRLQKDYEFLTKNYRALYTRKSLNLCRAWMELAARPKIIISHEEKSWEEKIKSMLKFMWANRVN